MKKQTALMTALALAATLLAAGCGKEEPPKRNQIPIIKESIYNLQQAVKDRDRVGLDSLLSARIIDNGESGDSLLSFCFGPEGQFGFDRFGDCEIVYTADHAIARCYVTDTAGLRNGPIRLTFEHHEIGPKKERKSVWLLSNFDQKPLSSDTTDAIDTSSATP